MYLVKTPVKVLIDTAMRIAQPGETLELAEADARDLLAIDAIERVPQPVPIETDPLDNDNADQASDADDTNASDAPETTTKARKK